MRRSGGTADPWPWRKLRWAKQSSCKLNRFAPPPWATGNRWSVCSRWERGAAAPGERIAITAASSVAKPDVSPDSRRNVTPRRGLVAAVDRIAGCVRRRPA